MPREDLENREEFTYAALGFDELYGDGSLGIGDSISEGKKNFIDDSIYLHETYKEDYDGTGVNEHEMGLMLKFVIELLGQISQSLTHSNPIHFKKSILEKLNTNGDTFQTLLNWVIENKIYIS